MDLHSPDASLPGRFAVANLVANIGIVVTGGPCA